jgi:hypothetical protein
MNRNERNKGGQKRGVKQRSKKPLDKTERLSQVGRHRENRKNKIQNRHQHLLLFKRNGVMGTGRDTNSIQIAFFMIDDGFAILQRNGTHGTSFDTMAGTGTTSFVDSNFHRNTP